MAAKPVQLDIYQVAIPMRSFRHAAADRDEAVSLVYRLSYDDGLVGYGETLPREYVTGETVESVLDDVERILWPKCLEGGLLEPDGPPKEIPTTYRRRCIAAAACGLDVAAFRRVFHDIHAIDPQMLQQIAHRARIRTYIDSTVTGVLGSADAKKTARRLRLMRWFGLRDFKLKLGLGEAVDQANLQMVHKQLRRGLEKQHYTLRVDINGGWDAADAPAKVAALKGYGVCVVEQPTFCSAAKLVDLADQCELPLMADESLLSEAHARTLLKAGDRIWWNIRLSKNGGVLAALKLMLLARQHAVPFTFGCMVGESSILSAAQRRVLQLGPVPRFVEGNYGRYLLADDLLAGRRSLRFGYGGTLRTRKGNGLGIAVSESKLARYGQLVKTLNA